MARIWLIIDSSKNEKGKKLMKNEQSKGYLQVLIAGLLWGTIGIWATLLGRMGMDSMSTAFFRLLSATLILFIILVIKGKGFKYFRISKRGLISCMLIGFLSQALYNYFYMYAVQTTGMAVAAVLLYTSPIFVAVISRLVFKEQMNASKITAIALNIAGCTETNRDSVLALGIERELSIEGNNAVDLLEGDTCLVGNNGLDLDGEIAVYLLSLLKDRHQSTLSVLFLFNNS